MPFHTVLGPHDFFVVTQILQNAALPWSSWQRFVAMFVFRAHCKSNLFQEAQLPEMLQEDFWKDPKSHFADNGKVIAAMLDFRRSTREAVQTGAFRSIPQRLCKDDDENLVRNVARRTQTLLDVATKVWPMLQDHTLSSSEKFRQISGTIQSAHGLGETWTKTLMVTIDIAYPELKILSETCNVGLGALKALKRLAPDHKNEPKYCQQSLTQVTAAANMSTSDAASGFWSMLDQLEVRARQRFVTFPLIVAQVKTPRGQLSVATVQVQLCEWRQFQEFLDKSGCPTKPLAQPVQPAKHESSGISDAFELPMPKRQCVKAWEDLDLLPGPFSAASSARSAAGHTEAEVEVSTDSEDRFLSAAAQLLETLKEQVMKAGMLGSDSAL